MLGDVPVAQWQSYLRYHLVDDASPYLSDAFVERALRVSRQDAAGAEGTEAALEARARRHRERCRRGNGPALRRRRLSAASSKARMEELVGNLARGAEGAHREPDLDERRDEAEGTRKVGHLHAEDRLSGQVARLDRPRHAARQLRRERARRPGVQLPLGARQDRQAGRQDRMGHDAADDQRLLQPAPERDRLPGRHPAAAVLRSEGRRRDELRRDRRRDRPRDDARLRRPGLALRADRQLRGVVDQGRRRRSSRR